MVLINHMETKVQDLEEDKLRIEDQCFKAIQDMDCMKIEMRSLVSKVDMSENHDLGEMHNLDSER